MIGWRLVRVGRAVTHFVLSQVRLAVGVRIGRMRDAMRRRR